MVYVYIHIAPVNVHLYCCRRAITTVATRHNRSHNHSPRMTKTTT